MEPNVRCGADGGTPSAPTCQLYVGHSGEHAALVMSDGRRRLRRWATAMRFSELDFTPAAAAGLSWAPGCPSLVPVPPPAKPALSVAAVNPDAVLTPKSGRLHIAS